MTPIRYLFSLIFLLTFLTAILINAFSIGQYYGIYIVVLIPAVGLHVVAGIQAWKKFPRFNWHFLLSSLCLPGFSLMRLDIDPHGLFNGYGACMARLGWATTEHTEPWAWSLEVSLVFLLTMIFIDTYIVRSRK